MVQRKMVAKYKWAQVSPKRKRFVSLSMLLQVEDLPSSGWIQAPDKTLRLCIAGFHDDIDLRAKKLGSIWAIRNIAHAETGRLLVLWIIPTSSSDDATKWVSTLERRVISNENVVIQANDFDASVSLEEYGVTEHQIVRFTKLNQRTESERDIKVIAGNVGNTVFVVRCLGENHGWSWVDALQVESLQSEKIRRIASSGNHSLEM